MFKKVCRDLFTILLPMILILTPHPIFAQGVRTNFDNTPTTVNDNLKDAIRYWWIAPLALVPLLFFLWPKEDNSSAYRRVNTYQSSVRKPKKAASDRRSSSNKTKRRKKA